jgi:hypothetical protein
MLKEQDDVCVSSIIIFQIINCFIGTRMNVKQFIVGFTRFYLSIILGMNDKSTPVLQYSEVLAWQ